MLTSVVADGLRRFLLLGLIMAVGSALLYHEFTEKPPGAAGPMFGFALMGLAGFGAILVGLFPENVNPTMHKVGAFLAIGMGNATIFALGGPAHPSGVHAALNVDVQ